MITRITGNRTRKNYKIFRWDLTNFCNQSCPYCIKNAPKLKPKYVTNYTYYINWINNNLKLDIPHIVQLFGGEPTLHPNFWEIVDSLQVPFGIYTNLSKSIEFFERLVKNERLHHIYCSFHSLSVNNRLDFENKLDFLCKCNNVELTLNIMLEHDDTYLFELFDKYKDKVTCVVTKIHNSNIIEVPKEYIHTRQHFSIYKGGEVNTFSSFDYDKLPEIKTHGFLCSTINYFNNIDIYGNITNYCRKYKITDVNENCYNRINVSKTLCRAEFCPKYCNVIGEKYKI
jgi:organic radical activating enzyme